MGVKFTEEQQQVIDLRNRNILVSAAAGSGKTAVLVERIITRLTKDEPPIDVDGLLIVTYTEAAAAEMKERIRDAIEKALEANPENVHLQRQATLIHSAQITTIHSFCLSVIRNYFHTIDLDPGFRIGEEGELKLLKRDVLEELLEGYYEEGSSEFLEFVECFASGRDDKKIEELILQLYEFSRSYPSPKKWLEGCVKQYEVDLVEELENTGFVKQTMEQIQWYLADLQESLLSGMDACDAEGGPYMYREALEADMAILQRLSMQKRFSQMYSAITEVKWTKLAANRDKNVSEELAGYVKNVREEVKKTVASIQEQYFFDTPEELCRDMQMAGENMKVLATLVIDFADAFAEKKRRRNLIDFGDMEQLALQILTREENGKLVPSEVAKEYQRRFEEVMIDEYQDSNLTQEAILTSVSKVSEGIYNVFMVGDVKQSIYRFRLSRPELFMEKFHTYSQSDSKTQRIDLHKNFRSRREVLDSTNFIFEQIMTKNLGGIEYDEKEALYVGASYEEHEGNETEVLLIDTDVEEDISLEIEETNRELEARAVARRIKELVGMHPILDKKTGAYRPARYSDIVILTRSLKGWTDVFLEVLMREGVPAYSGSKEGYFEAREIRIMLDYLRVLDNPRQDIPFVAVLVSCFGGVSNEELAEIKSSTNGRTFYERVCEYISHGECLELQSKLKAFLSQLEGFRKKVPYTAIHQLLWNVIEETGYGDYVAAMPGGEQRAANLEMLIEKAVSFESTSYKGLFHFVRYIEQLHKYDIDYSEANIVDEQADVVRLMSIHKSKGLEFPIVFVSGMNKKFNQQDVNGSIVVHPELGVGMDAVDVAKRTKTPTLLKRMIQKNIRMENAGEELRVLYVAMTRAKEKLILTGTISDLEKRWRSYENLRNRRETSLTFSRLTNANTYFDWVLPALYRHQSFAPILGEYQIPVPFMNPLYKRDVPLRVRRLNIEKLVMEEEIEEYQAELAKEILFQWDTTEVYDEAINEQLNEQFHYHYPYEREGDLKQKMTVSELKKRVYLEEEGASALYEEADVIPLLPRFMQEETELTGASRGSAYHKLLELLDFTRDYDRASLKMEIEFLQEEGRLSKEMADCIEPENILQFLHSSIGKRVQKASKEEKCYAEQPFVLGVDAKEIYKEDTLDSMILVQGIIDVYFEEDGELVVLDYKTDKVFHAEELREKYYAQLEYYATALERLTGKRVKQKVIYSFALHKEIEV